MPEAKKGIAKPNYEALPDDHGFLEVTLKALASRIDERRAAEQTLENLIISGQTKGPEFKAAEEGLNQIVAGVKEHENYLAGRGAWYVAFMLGGKTVAYASVKVDTDTVVSETSQTEKPDAKASEDPQPAQPEAAAVEGGTDNVHHLKDYRTPPMQKGTHEIAM